MRKVLQGQMKKGCTNKCCPLCERAMNDNELIKFQSSVETKIKDPRIDDKIKLYQQNLENLENTVKLLEENCDNYRKMKEMLNEIPNLEEEAEKIKIKADEYKKTIQELDDQKNEFKNKLDNVKKIKDVIELLSTSQKEIKVLKEEKNTHYTEFKQNGIDINEINSVNNKLIESKQKRDELYQQLRKHMESYNEINTKIKQYSLKLNQYKETKNTIIEYSKRKEEYERKMKENNKKIEDNKSSILKYQNDNKNIESIYKNIKSKETEHNNIYNKRINDIKIRESEIQKKSITLNTLLGNYKNIAYSNLTNELNQYEKDKISLENDMNELSKTNEGLVELTKNINENLTKMHEEYIQIDYNIKYRDELHKVDKIKERMEEIKKLLPHDIKVDDISSEMKNLRIKLNTSQREYKYFIFRINEKRGSLKTYQDRINDDKLKLKNPNYLNIEDRISELLIKKDTCSLAIDDIDLTMKTINDSLVQYHSTKIDEINDRISELWKQTYSGEDIDTIRLVAEPSTNTGRLSRSYNYHIEMEKVYFINYIVWCKNDDER